MNMKLIDEFFGLIRECRMPDNEKVKVNNGLDFLRVLKNCLVLSNSKLLSAFAANPLPGFVIGGKRVLTNAHVVADHIFVLVRKHGSPTKYRATVQAVGHECDLAILLVQSEELWEGVNSLELGDVPFLQEAVSVVGYLQGGDNISVTKGVVSRVELTQYLHGASQLLTIQIDAAINPGK
ncbi:hypothetical protein K7X08_034944 [Anisodus acutangulus]|uniref:Uncharacterized protein n=1 Tax=Anisodus acutangulus TaxID=402998 RepID=A0A9Q1LK27_9SOLA|nr:hypothetical protein K7X08_034944 [Anisodus acutangulus]